MSVEPQKWFIGLMDFFSILLPGAVITYLTMDAMGPVILGDRYKATGTQAWAVFLVSSYLLGHIIFLLGAWLDEFYDWARGYTLNRQIYLLARRGRLLRWPARWLLWLVFKYERNLAVDRAAKIKLQALRPLGAQSSVNTFQWSKAMLTAESPEGLATVQRFEADSKFFRSLVVVLIALEAMWAWQQRWRLVAIGAVLLILSMWRYMEQRYKATNQAYWFVIALAGRKGGLALPKAAPAAGSPTHAGGVVFKRGWRRTTYLLVEASKDPTQWVLPKGRIEDGEDPYGAAVREVHEETGVWARIRDPLKAVTLAVDGAQITIQFYLMEALASGRRSDPAREHEWLPLDKAVARASYAETRDLLNLADLRRSSNRSQRA